MVGFSYCTYQGRRYEPRTPEADNGIIVDRGDRLIFKHGSPTMPEAELFVAEKGIVHAGWVLGVFIED